MAQRGRKRTVSAMQIEKKPIYLMKKKDLRTGMIVKLRNGRKFFVMLNTGLKGEEENVMFNGGLWLSLDWFDDDMRASGRCDPFGELILMPGRIGSSDYDVMKVYGIRSASEISGCMSREEYVLYERMEV